MRPDAYVACEGPYLVQVRDPAINPPNLAAVQEVSAGIYRVALNVTVPDVELWVDDIRLSQPVSQTGLAGSVDARLTASDVGSIAASYIKQNGQFRQINQDPTYRGSDAFQLGSNVQLDRFLPASFGLAIPLTVTYARTGDQPRAAQWHRSPWRVAAGTQAARIVECHLLTLAPADRARHQLDHPGFLDPLSIAASRTAGTESDRSVERRGERLRRESLTISCR